MVDTGSMRKGITMIMDGELYKIMEYNHVKQGRGTAFVRLTLRNVRTGATTIKTIMAGERYEQARLDSKKVTFLYPLSSTATTITFISWIRKHLISPKSMRV
jgi:elongation factor P